MSSIFIPAFSTSDFQMWQGTTAALSGTPYVARFFVTLL